MNLTLFKLAQIADRGDVNLPGADLDRPTAARVLQLFFAIAGGIAVLVITIAGLFYVLSQGNPQATNKAKQAIIDALIGLVICLASFSIVTFVTSRL